MAKRKPAAIATQTNPATNAGEAAVMAAPDVVEAEDVASRSRWAPVMGAAKVAVMAAPDAVKAEDVASRSRWARVMGAAKVAVMAAPDVVKAEDVASRSRWDPAVGVGVAKAAKEAVASKTCFPLRRLRPRRGPNRGEERRTRRPLHN